MPFPLLPVGSPRQRPPSWQPRQQARFDARAIAGHRSAEIEQILGFRGRDEMIHRDDLVFHGGDMPATTGDDTEEAQAS